MPIGPITRARAKKSQEALNGLVKRFIWANSTFKEESKSNQVFEGIGANKEVHMSINIIMAIDGNNPHDIWQLKGDKIIENSCSISFP